MTAYILTGAPGAGKTAADVPAGPLPDRVALICRAVRP